MSLINKVNKLPFICGIELDFEGSISASNDQDFLNFYNSYYGDNNFQSIYFGKKSVRFLETSSNTADGIYYTQTLTIRFPSNDENRALNLDTLNKVKYIKIKLDDGRDMIMGRNDAYQNKKPSVKIKSTIQSTQVEFTCKSITPISFIGVDLGIFGLPIDIPIDFYNVV